MSEIVDPEFGTVTIRRSAQAHTVRIRVAPDGRLRASAPLYTPLYFIRRLIKTSRPALRTMLAESQPETLYESGMAVGKSHTLRIEYTPTKEPKVSRHGQQLVLSLPLDTDSSNTDVQRLIRDHVITALRREAKSYLPRRLRYLAEQGGFDFEKVRFSHASGRWGSCSSNGTISLNIALMKLPFELIDYVLIHELSHTRQMNHSREFWALVEHGDPEYKVHRRALREETPTI